jgi:hypothetical protein
MTRAAPVKPRVLLAIDRFKAQAGNEIDDS